MECKVGDVVMPGWIIQEADALAKDNKKVILGELNLMLVKVDEMLNNYVDLQAMD